MRFFSRDEESDRASASVRGRVVLSGWLTLLKKSAVKRYFVLSGAPCELRVFATSTASKPKETIDLSILLGVEETNNPKLPGYSTFQLYMRKKDIQLGADSEQDRAAWIAAIREAVDARKSAAASPIRKMPESRLSTSPLRKHPEGKAPKADDKERDGAKKKKKEARKS